MSKRKYILCILSIILLVIIGILGRSWVDETRLNQSKIQNSRLYPVIFIPGSSATVNRFDDLFNKLNANPNQKHSVLKINIKKDGQYDISGTIRQTDFRPFIVIGFENNADGYSNIKKQASYIDDVLTLLQNRYHFHHFDAIGHSNGGLIWTRYLEKYFNNQQFVMNHLMTLGTPYNFSETSISRKTEMLKDMIQGRTQLPSNLIVYSIAGTEDYTDDGIVPVQSVTAGKYIFQNYTQKYMQITLSGNEAQHSNLPDNNEVVSIINQYILTDNSNPRNPTNAPK
ncbi:alpha/beta hydrolase [Leuconostoc fallax]|uniref:alpha/beta hydrolase n=1 Tax=Leuconostoc fallax TaxID=1251 RepID=UPI00052471A9|nr:alpha/beta hydrolase [Leuconostoc fallax]MBU7456262.1 alpha/beta hydrolase [Leuconostoc fallax]MCO6184424.1 alpha/beta hydrolase [Leuconostoc fallax]